MEQKTHWLENFIVVIILFVLIQTFVEDLAVLLSWTWSVRKILIVTGFAFDLFFTIEFFTRVYMALHNGRLKRYLVHQRGWVDFLASVPLLLLNSGPSALALVIGGGTFISAAGALNVLKVVKAIRIARILRLLRVLKIFRNIKYADSVMAQRHMTKIVTISITTIVFSFLIINVLLGFTPVPSSKSLIQEYHQESAVQLSSQFEQEIFGTTALFLAPPELLILKQGNTTLHSLHSGEYYAENFGPMDYEVIEIDQYEFFFDIRRANMLEARDNIILFLAVLVVVSFFLFYYSPHFAMTVTDPINIMRKGMGDKNYNLEIEIPSDFHDDEVYLLSQHYNDEFLPMKNRQESDAAGSSELKLDDMNDLFEGLD